VKSTIVYRDLLNAGAEGLSSRPQAARFDWADYRIRGGASASVAEPETIEMDEVQH
jgi:hypothetical protein